ncbi:hypothetical protein D3C85_1029340 [compost metagenome]
MHRVPHLGLVDRSHGRFSHGTCRAVTDQGSKPSRYTTNRPFQTTCCITLGPFGEVQCLAAKLVHAFYHEVVGPVHHTTRLGSHGVDKAFPLVDHLSHPSVQQVNRLLHVGGLLGPGHPLTEFVHQAVAGVFQ